MFLSRKNKKSLPKQVPLFFVVTITVIMSVTMFTSSTKMYFEFWNMIGHEISDVTEKVYTKRDESWLHTEIEKIK